MPFWPLLLAILISLLLTALLIRLSAWVGWVDSPNARSSHTIAMPRGGGLAIVISTLLTVPLILQGGRPPIDPWTMHGIVATLLLGLPVAAVGLMDDRTGVAPRWRLLTHALVVLTLLLWLAPLPGLLLAQGIAMPPVPLALGLWFFGVAWVNAYNFMDGVDGLAASQTLFMTLSAGTLSVIGSPDTLPHPITALMITIACTSAGFLWFNWAPARIFMGDVGSTWLGFMIFALAILTVREGWMNFGSWLILGAVFVVDTSLTLLGRIVRREKWLQAHRSHAYQQAVKKLEHTGHDRTQAHRRVTLGITALNLIWLMPMAWAAQHWPSYNMALCMIAYLPLVMIVLRTGGRPHRND
jgi:Fuc2NAc and GlcNAc transferase